MIEALISLIESSLGINISGLFLVYGLAFSIILLVLDIRLSAMFLFLFSAISLIVAYNLQYDYTINIIILLISLIYLALSLFASEKYKVGAIIWFTSFYLFSHFFQL